MKLLLFDIDATLILTGGAGLRALDRAFQRHYNVDAAMHGIAPHGKTDPAIVREILQARLKNEPVTELVLATVLRSYLEFLQEEVGQTSSYQVLPGIVEILEELTARTDVLLGLATGNVELGARIKLQRGDLNRFFAFGGYGSDSEYRAELVRGAAAKAEICCGAKIAKCDVFVIGDTPKDVEAGKASGFRTVGVATGQYSVDQLLESGADVAIPDFLQGRDYFLRTTFID